jgi:hypothetical protein
VSHAHPVPRSQRCLIFRDRRDGSGLILGAIGSLLQDFCRRARDSSWAGGNKRIIPSDNSLRMESAPDPPPKTVRRAALPRRTVAGAYPLVCPLRMSRPGAACRVPDAFCSIPRGRSARGLLSRRVSRDARWCGRPPDSPASGTAMLASTEARRTLDYSSLNYTYHWRPAVALTRRRGSTRAFVAQETTRKVA